MGERAITFEILLADGITKVAEHASEKMSELGKHFSELSEKMGEASKKAGGGSGGLKAGFSELAEGGIGLAGGAAIAAVAAFGALTAAGVGMALNAAEAREEMTTLFDALGQGKITGEQTVDMIDDLGDQLNQTRDKLAPLTKAFMTMGVTGEEQLRGLTVAAASAEALAVGGSGAFTKLFSQVNAAAESGQKLTIPYKKLNAQLLASGLNIGDLASQMGMTEAALTAGLKAGTVSADKLGDALTDAATDKGAGALAAAGMKLSNVWDKFKENISKMFEGIEVGPFLAQVKSLFAIFSPDKTTPSGQAMKAGIGGFFKGVFELLTKLVPVVKHFFLDLVILALKAYISVKPVLKTLEGIWASVSGKGGVVTVVVSALGFAFSLLGDVIGVLWNNFVQLLNVGLQVIGFVLGLSAALMGMLAGPAQAVADWVLSAADAAANFVEGLVNGIANGAGMLIDAVKNLAGSAVDAFKGILGIHSPSAVMAGLGANTSMGFAQGIDDGADSVVKASSSLAGQSIAATQNAAGSMGSVSMQSPQAPANDNGGKSGGGASVVVEAGAIVIEGAGKSGQEITEEMVSSIFERFALQAGR